MNKGKRNIVYVFSFIVLFILIMALLGVIEKNIGMIISLSLALVFSVLNAFIAHKNDIKIIEFLMILFAILSVVMLVMNIMGYKKILKTKVFKFQVTAEVQSSPKTFLFEYGGKKYYSYNLTNINIVMKNKKVYTLEEALTKNIVTLDEILSLAAPSNNTTGYKIYYDIGQDNYENDEYSIVLCEGNSNDVVFSTFNYKYEEGICN